MPTPLPIVPDFANESELQAYCIKYAVKEFDAVCWLIKKANTRGVLDLYMGLHGGVSVWVEFKHPNGKGVLSPQQQKRHNELSDRGIPVYVCASFTVFQVIMSHHIRKIPTHDTKKVAD